MFIYIRPQLRYRPNQWLSVFVCSLSLFRAMKRLTKAIARCNNQLVLNLFSSPSGRDIDTQQYRSSFISDRHVNTHAARSPTSRRLFHEGESVLWNRHSSLLADTRGMDASVKTDVARQSWAIPVYLSGYCSLCQYLYSNLTRELTSGLRKTACEQNSAIVAVFCRPITNTSGKVAVQLAIHFQPTIELGLSFANWQVTPSTICWFRNQQCWYTRPAMYSPMYEDVPF